MPADPPLPRNVTEIVRGVIADVLVVPLERVQPESALIGDLGAESIDFLDLVFRLEDALGQKIPAEHWDAFLRRRLAGRDPGTAITTRLVCEFADEETRG